MIARPDWGEMIAVITLPEVSGIVSNLALARRAAPFSVPIQSAPDSSVFSAGTRPGGKPSALIAFVRRPSSRASPPVDREPCHAKFRLGDRVGAIGQQPVKRRTAPH